MSKVRDKGLDIKFPHEVNLKEYKIENLNEHPAIDNLEQISEQDKEIMIHAGIDTGNEKGGTFLMKDQSVIHTRVKQPGIELLSIHDVKEKYPEFFQKYYWKLIAPDTDKYTKFVHDNIESGYFIYIKKGVKGFFPIQSCLFLEHPGIVQNVHNLIILEENSSLEIITGCTSKDLLSEGGAHLGITEIYVGKGAQLTYSMIHNWHELVRVRPRTSIYVEEGGTLVSNYVLLKKVKDVQMNPIAYLAGRGAKVRFNSIIVSYEDSYLDIGARVVLDAPETSTEIISRVVNRGGKVIARGLISGNVPGVRGHLECHGLILNEGGEIYTIPQLNGLSPDIMLSHEAAVGKIAREEVEYLMARGIEEDDAVGLIIRGFLYEGLENFPSVLKLEIDRVIEETKRKGY